MNVDQAIQSMLAKPGLEGVKRVAYLAIHERNWMISRCQNLYRWNLEDCNEYLDNAILAYAMLVERAA